MKAIYFVGGFIAMSGVMVIANNTGLLRQAVALLAP
jgi:hypothetical protein